MPELSSALGTVDLIIVGVLALSVLISFVRGFVRELISLIIWAIAIAAALFLAPKFQGFLSSYVANPSMAYVASFAVVMVIVLIPGSIFNSFISLVLCSGRPLALLNRLLGAVFGLARGILIVGVVLLFSMNLSQTEPRLAPYFSGVTDWMQNVVPGQVAEFSKSYGLNKEDY